MWKTAFVFSNRSDGLQKKLFKEENKIFSVDYVKISELHVVHTWRQMQSGRWNNGGNDIYKKDQ